MSNLPMRSQASAAAGLPEPIGAVGPQPDNGQGGAPAGPFFSESELPISATSGGGGARTGGFSSHGEQAPLPAPGSDTGSGLAPSGNRK